MKRKKERRVKRKLALLLATALTIGLVSYMPNGAVEVQAGVDTSASTEKAIVGLGTSGIGNPATPDTSTAWSGSYVYFGSYGANNVKYRVLANGTTAFSGDGTTKTMLLDCDNVLWNVKFKADSNLDAGASKLNEWKYSDIYKSLNTNSDSFLQTSFSALERAAIADSTKKTTVDGDGKGGLFIRYQKETTYLSYTALDGEKIFLLDAAEASNENYGYSNTYAYNTASNRKKKDLYSNAVSWWLRSPSANQTTDAGYMNKSGYPCESGGVTSLLGVSPALNINLSSVLFTSAIPNTAGEYKLTLLDQTGGMGVGVTANETIYKDGKTLTIPYAISGTNSGSVNQVSVLITDSPYTEGNPNEAKNIAYGALSGGISGKGTYTIPDTVSGTCGVNYYVYLVAEDVNDGCATDYACMPVDITAAVASATATPTTTPTTTGDTTTTSNDTNTGTTTAGTIDTNTGTITTGTIDTTTNTDTTTGTTTNNNKNNKNNKKNNTTDSDKKKDDDTKKNDGSDTGTSDGNGGNDGVGGNGGNGGTTGNSGNSGNTSGGSGNSLESGTGSGIVTVVDSKDIPTETKNQISSAVEKILKRDSNIKTGGYVKSDSEDISFAIPEDILKEGRSYYLVTLDDDGNVKILQNESTEDGMFFATGEADTTYQIIYEEGAPLASVISEDGTLKEDADATTCYWHWGILAVTLVGIALGLLLNRKSKKYFVIAALITTVINSIFMIVGSCMIEKIFMPCEVVLMILVYVFFLRKNDESQEV